MTASAKFAAALIVALTFLAGCGPKPATTPPDAVTVQLKWVHQAQFAGMYIAGRQGFYADEHLTVTLHPGGNEIPPDQITADLAAGKSDFAVVGGDSLLEARARGEPLVAVAVIFQKNPYVYVSLAESGIRHPQDLVGKRVMVPSSGAGVHAALLHRLGIDPESIHLVPFEASVTPLMSGEVDAQLVYRTGSGLAFDELKTDLNWIYVEDYGIHIYADTLVTTEAMIRDHPELVTRFLRATLKGWRYAIENPNEAVDETRAYDPALDRDIQVRMMAAQIPFIHTGEAPIGWMTLEAWQATQTEVSAKPVDINQVFTMQFLDDVYGKDD